MNVPANYNQTNIAYEIPPFSDADEYRQNKESVKIFNSIDLYWKEGYMYNDVPEPSVLSELQF